jgi:hypothetical protein
MCRSIKVLRNPEGPATEEDLTAAARQFVRKISGFHKPSKVNTPAFEQAIAEIAESSRRLLDAVSGRAANSIPPTSFHNE